MFDIHSHILPGLDDGAPDWQESIAMARIAVQDGIEGIICTPHWVPGISELSRGTILELVESFREQLAGLGIDLSIYPGAELRVDADLPERIEKGEAITLNESGQYALVELPMDFIPQGVGNLFYDIQVQDITPILAHPERNLALKQNVQPLLEWAESGVIIQVTAASLLGRFGGDVRKFTVQLMERGIVHVIATDSHGPHVRTPVLSEARREAELVVGAEEAWRMVHERPLAIVAGRKVSQPQPVIPENRSRGVFRKLFSLFHS